MKTARLLSSSLAAISAAALASGCAEGSSLQTIEKSTSASIQTMSVQIKDYAPKANGAFQHLFVSNFSAKASHGQLLKSTARDGMDDLTKLALQTSYGFDQKLAESAHFGFLDLFLFNMGVKAPQQTSLFCAQTGASADDALTYSDSRWAGSPVQFMGLRDCEKQQLNLDVNKFDNAGNGVPDYLKLRCGMNLASKNAAYISTAGDGVADIDKCKRNIPLDESASTEANQAFAYQYSSELKNQGASTDFKVSNIPVVDEGDANFIAIYVVEADLAGGPTTLYTRYAILQGSYASKTLVVSWWGKSGDPLRNRPLVLGGPQ